MCFNDKISSYGFTFEQILNELNSMIILLDVDILNFCSALFHG